MPENPQKIQDILARLPRPMPLPAEPFGPAVLQCDIHGPHVGNWAPTPYSKDGTRDWEEEGECPGCEADLKISRLIGRANVAPRFAHCQFSNYVATTPKQIHALTTCRDYAEDFRNVRATGRCLVMIGTPGTGKNHLAAAMTRVIAAQGFTTLHTTAYEIIKSIRATWQTHDSAAELEVIRAFTDVDLLIVDEVGRSFGSQHEMVHFFEVIDRRYRDIKPTVIMSNQTLADVEKVLGLATFDRLREGGSLRVTFAWASHRDKV